ncbi:MAG: class I SAM-dependent methyltransferase family protein [Candidatus Heimdallarchaeota archaeon]
MGFKDNLKQKLKSVLTEQELSYLPSGFQNLGKVIILRLDSKLFESRFLIGEACLDIFPNYRSVYLNSGKIVGKFRTPEKMELIAGEDNPIVEHKEHNVIYKFDITKLMFSKGNVNERKYLATLVKENEIIVDMFAGIGYFSLPIAKNAKPKRIYSIELNPDAYRYLVENIKLNHLEDIIIPIQGDCKQEVIKLSKSGILVDRVIMGVFPAPKDYVKDALSLVKEKGTIYHYEGVTKKEEYLLLFEEFKAIAKTENLNCKILGKRFVKSYGPNLYHTVIDILALKT